MRLTRFIVILAMSFMFAQWAVAGFPPVRIGGILQSLVTKFTLLFPAKSVVNRGGVTAYIDTDVSNLLHDGSFEGIALSSDWTLSGGTATFETADKVDGNQALRIAASASTPILRQTVSTKSGLPLVVGCMVKTDQNFVEICAKDNTTDVLCTNVPSDNTWRLLKFPIVAGNDGGIEVRSSQNITGNIDVDKCRVEYSDTTQDIAQAEVIGQLRWVGDTGCNWYRTKNANWQDAPINANCANPTVIKSGISNDGDKSLHFILPAGSQAGDYTIDVTLPHVNQFVINNVSCRFRFKSTNIQSTTQEVYLANVIDNTIPHAQYRFKLDSALTSDEKIYFQMRGNSTSSGICGIRSDLPDMSHDITVTYYPPKSKIVTQNRNDWFVDVNIGGANPAMSLGNVTSYTEITNASLDMVLRDGSQPAEIPCSGTNPSTGITCSSGNESLGVVFTPPNAGYYDVCFYGSDLRAHANYTTYGVYQLQETPNNSQTILQNGGSKISTAVGDQQSGVNYNNISHCSTFKFSDTNKKTIRLMYTQLVTGVPNTNPLILASRPAHLGERDVRITVRPALNSGVIVGEFEQIKTTELCQVIANNNDGESITASTEDIPWKNVIKDDCGLWSNAGNTGNNTNDAYTARQDGFILVTGSAHSTNSNAGGNNVKVYENNVNMNIECGLNDNLLFQTGLHCLVPVVKNSVYTFRYAVSESLGTGLDHRITIVELPDIAGIVKNLNEGGGFLQAPNTANIKTCYYAFGGAGSLTSPTVCSSSPCTEYYDSCGAITSVTRVSTGLYSVVFGNGTWKASSFLNCHYDSKRTATGILEIQQGVGSTDFISTNSSGGYSAQLVTYTTAGANADGIVTIKCEGEAP